MYIHVRVLAGAKAEKLEETKPGYFRVSVKEKAEMNRANTRVLELIAGQYKGKKIRLVSGHHSPSKIFSVL